MENEIEKKSQILKAAANAKRLEILHCISKKEHSVGALEKLIDLSQSALSQHLAVLRRAGMVKTRRKAQTIYYSLSNEQVKKLLKIFDL